MHALLQIGLTNAVIATVLAVVVYCVTRVWRNPPVARALWLLVLLKLITPPIVSIPIPMGPVVSTASAVQPIFPGPEGQFDDAPTPGRGGQQQFDVKLKPEAVIEGQITADGSNL